MAVKKDLVSIFNFRRCTCIACNELRSSPKKNGTAQPSLTASLLEELAMQPDAASDQEDVIRNVAAQAYVGGVETVCYNFLFGPASRAVFIMIIILQVHSSLHIFVLAMVLYPEAQRKAQAELDSLIGLNRLPNFEDRKRLPYVNALCNEVLRWHPAVPLALPHRILQDDIYGDYFIPGGSVIVGNAWYVLVSVLPVVKGQTGLQWLSQGYTS